MSTNTKESNIEVELRELELRPLELHELEIVSDGLYGSCNRGLRWRGRT